MYVLCVYVHVKPEHRAEFVEVTLDNARNTVKEPGNVRFDVVQQADDENRFMLYEVYRDESGLAAHRTTAHYARWMEAVGVWMAEPRSRVIYSGLFIEGV